jgi:hypothetical protein
MDVIILLKEGIIDKIRNSTEIINYLDTID